MDLKNNQLLYWILFACVCDHVISNYGAVAIRGGSFDYDNKFNYQVSIQKRKTSGAYQHGCGGSIIGEKYILTAAHCFVSKKGEVLNPTNGNMRILAGTNNLHKEGIVRNIDKVFIPKSYRHKNHLAISDIAVVKVQNSLFAGLNKRQRLIQIIPLVEKFDYAKYENQNAIVSGFGVTEPNATTLSTTRKYLEVKITAERDCTELDSIVCVLSQRQSTLGVQGFCHGDSGGPVVVDGRLLGVVSRGAKADCDMRSKVGKLTLVPQYLDFIRKANGSVHDKHDIVVLPDMTNEAINIFTPTTPLPTV